MSTFVKSIVNLLNENTFRFFVLLILISAYSTSVSASIIYVNHAAEGKADGKSWKHAFTTIQSAIDEAVEGDEIRVSQGTYLESLSMKSGVKLYGGVRAKGWFNSQSKADKFITIVDAKGSGRSAISFHETTNTLVDGLTITGGGDKNNKGKEIVNGGGLVFLAADDSNTVSNCLVSNNSGKEGGGINLVHSSPKFLKCTISDNTAQSGGGVHISEESSPIFTDCVINENEAMFQGGVLAKESSLIFRNCTIDKNIGLKWIGGMFLWDADVTLTHCSISKNFNGGLEFQNSSSTLIDCVIDANTERQGVRLSNSDITFTRCTINENTSGALDITLNSSPIFSKCEINGNSDRRNTAVVIVDNESTSLFVDCALSRNIGSALSSYDSIVDLQNCMIMNNSGGGIGLSGSPSRITKCLIANNGKSGIGLSDSSPIISDSIIAGNKGTGLSLGSQSNPKITNCTISGNSRGLRVGDSSPFLSNCIISGNSFSEGYGGGLYVSGKSNPTLLNCVIAENSAWKYGGGIYIGDDSTPELINCIFYGNSRYAICSAGEDSSFKLTHSLFNDNSDGDYFLFNSKVLLTGAEELNSLNSVDNSIDGAPSFLGGEKGEWSHDNLYDSTINSTILKDESASFVPGALVGRLINVNTKQRFQSLIIGNTETEIIIAGDISYLLYDSNEHYFIIDYHIKADSAARGMGVLSQQVASDIDGHLRSKQGFSDIGVDEYIDINNDKISDSTFFMRPLIEGIDLNYDRSDSARTTSPLNIVYVKRDAVGRADGSSWRDAYTSIQKAIDGSTEGDHIWVAQGTYSEAISLKSGISIYGGYKGNRQQASTRDFSINKTIIDASGLNGNVVTMEFVKDVIFDGFIVTGGVASGEIPLKSKKWRYSYTGGGGIYVYSADSTNLITNCTVTNNKAIGKISRGYGGGLYIYGNSSLRIENCIIRENSAKFGGGLSIRGDSKPVIRNCLIEGNTNERYGAFHISNASPVIEGCEIYNNKSVLSQESAGIVAWSQFTMVNSLIKNNDGEGILLFSSNPTLNNCVIIGNGKHGIRSVSSSPFLENCRVSNHAKGYGFYNSNPGARKDNIPHKPKLSDCIFYNNQFGDYYERTTYKKYIGSKALNNIEGVTGTKDKE